MKVIIEIFYQNRPIRLYKILAPTLRSERIGLLVIEDIHGENRNKTSDKKRLHRMCD